ncbi:MAG TPA: hypothetical protein VFJ29_01695 [Candidatus Kapabacteria bacterium]|nr:hypothetical protein [Candidatus Kapabacteria bacterium]
MSAKHLLLGTLILGVVGNIFDMIVHGMLLGPTYAGIEAMASKESMNPAFFVLFDFIGAFLFTWVYGKVQSSFEKSPKGVMMYGVLAALLISIPGMLFEAVMYKGFPMWLSIAWIAAAIVKLSILGYILGMLVKPKKATA